MLPYDHRAPHVAWHQAWRTNIWKAKNNPEEREGYSRAAAISQAMYVIYVALELARYKK